MSASEQAKQAALARQLKRAESLANSDKKQDQSITVGNYAGGKRKGIKNDGGIVILKGPLTNASIATGTVIEDAAGYGDFTPRDDVRRRRVQKIKKTDGILPFLYGVPFTYEYQYAPNGATEEIESFGTWLYTRDLQRVPVNHIDFIEIKYSGADELEIEPVDPPDPVCQTFVTSWYQHYAAAAARIRLATGASPAFFYNQFTVTECQPPPDPGPRARGDYLHRAQFIEHQLKIGPFDAFLTYQESINHPNGLGNRSSASFSVYEEGSDLGYIGRDYYVLHPDQLLDFEDQSTEIEPEGKNILAGSQMPYFWTLSSSVDSISGQGTKEVGAAFPQVARVPVEENEILNNLTPQQVQDFLATGVTPVQEKDVLVPGGDGYSATNSVQLPIVRLNGQPYISSSNEIDFLATRQQQSVLRALGPIDPLPANHDYYDAWFGLPYRVQGLHDWVIPAGGRFDPKGNLRAYPLKMPKALADKIAARSGRYDITAVAHSFCNLIEGPPTLLFPSGNQAYRYEAWAQNKTDPENIVWELRDVSPAEYALDWRHPTQNDDFVFTDPCLEQFRINRFSNVANAVAFEATVANLAPLFANAAIPPAVVSVPFTGKSVLVEQNACTIGASTKHARKFPGIAPTEGVVPLAAAPNKPKPIPAP